LFIMNERRYVATTRKDGSMRIDVTAEGQWTIERVTVRDWPRRTSPFRSQLNLGAVAAFGVGQNPLASGLACNPRLKRRAPCPRTGPKSAFPLILRANKQRNFPYSVATVRPLTG
jgi:hypothetical protein